MTNTNKRITEEVEKTLQAFDADPALPANPFFMTRIEAGLHQQMQTRRFVLGAFFRLKYIVVLILFAVNVVTHVQYSLRSTEQDLTGALVSQLEDAFDIDHDLNNF